MSGIAGDILSPLTLLGGPGTSFAAQAITGEELSPFARRQNKRAQRAAERNATRAAAAQRLSSRRQGIQGGLAAQLETDAANRILEAVEAERARRFATSQQQQLQSAQQAVSGALLLGALQQPSAAAQAQPMAPQAAQATGGQAAQATSGATAQAPPQPGQSGFNIAPPVAGPVPQPAAPPQPGQTGFNVAPPAPPALGASANPLSQPQVTPPQVAPQAGLRELFSERFGSLEQMDPNMLRGIMFNPNMPESRRRQAQQELLRRGFDIQSGSQATDVTSIGA